MGDDLEIFIFNVEKCFDVIELMDDTRRIYLATFMLDSHAARWW